MALLSIIHMVLVTPKIHTTHTIHTFQELLWWEEMWRVTNCWLPTLIVWELAGCLPYLPSANPHLFIGIIRFFIFIFFIWVVRVLSLISSASRHTICNFSESPRKSFSKTLVRDRARALENPNEASSSAGPEWWRPAPLMVVSCAFQVILKFLTLHFY